MTTPNKIRATHLERTAIIYVRQSTPAQVRDHRELQARQYGLVEEAARLGWPASQIEVIDTDLGISGRTTERRAGFREVVSRVCLGEVGAIVGLEVARLARSNADFARLLELARLTDTLVIDTDGMYDLREFNDRLLLGLKGAMSEALCGRPHNASLSVVRNRVLKSSSVAHVLVTYCGEGLCWHHSGWDRSALSSTISVSRRIIFASTACWS